MFFKKIYVTCFAVVLLSAFFVESSLVAALTSTSVGGNLRKTEKKETKTDTIENPLPEDDAFWKRALSMSTDLAYFGSDPTFHITFGSNNGDNSASFQGTVDLTSCGESCKEDSDCHGICKTCSPTGNCTNDAFNGNTLTVANGAVVSTNNGNTPSVTNGGVEITDGDNGNKPPVTPDTSSCGSSCKDDSECHGICNKCHGVDPKFNPTGSCGA